MPRLLSGAVTLVAVVLVGAVLILGNVYMPLAEGSASGADSNVPGSLFLDVSDDPFQAGQVYTYCSMPDGRFAWLVSLRNLGPLPLTLLAGEPGPGATPIGDVIGLSLVDFASYWRSTPTDTPLETHGATDPRTAPRLPPTTLASQAEINVWARFQMGGVQLAPGTGIEVRSLWVRYSIFGVERTAEVPLRDGVAIRGAACPNEDQPTSSTTGG